MILLHGGPGSAEMVGPILPALAERHQVVATDLQGHGRTADLDRPIPFVAPPTCSATSTRSGSGPTDTAGLSSRRVGWWGRRHHSDRRRCRTSGW
ncbi:MAG: alpha/beta fold hydrolase [Acidimicrobiia bacterium]